MQRIYLFLAIVCTTVLINGCTVLAVADAAVSTTVKVGSAVVGTAVDVTAAGVRTVTNSNKEK
ncbi:hypothetical protein LPB67_06885 [Undibacterium sp. Jales W-56]|uniref:hypothetical protein n=1 Tax=Undibacterium sp. Jales W-56 TaxID=2897325 RepID=UPI0021D3CADD|nr:hypothetical protein [Undibacterium sp. Jales W-56]MCU6433505.1 hypothetical protein [Undibacterium sp. Jales W-56]